MASSPFYDPEVYAEPQPWANRPSTILGITITFMILSGLSVLSRLYVRFKVVRSPGWDDLFVGLYLMTTTAAAIAICLLPSYGLGDHLLHLDVQKLRMFLILFYVANACYVSSTAFIKLSLLFQYLRIFEHGTILRRICTTLIIIIALWGTAYAFMAWFPCFPVSGFWMVSRTAKCYAFGASIPNPDAFAATFESHTATNMVFDIMVLAIPIPLYFEQGTPSKARVNLVVLFSMGCLVNVFAVWRLGTIIQHKGGTYPILDPTWYGPSMILLAVLEVSVASICGSVPVFWPVLSERLGFSGRIFVTREVEVTTEERLKHMRGISDSSSSNSSTTDLPIQGEEEHQQQHYMDAFIIGQVDPLRRDHVLGADAHVTCDRETAPERRRWHIDG
ncbi:hypothetical protein QBC46DRAFT_342628 [Diplogelasinospora grovesii]|uniref:Rhodopsin domain-containing protein n=1 Tax=Diplogelasinospora grovesii TaxID=303347 RepID=A0AAN6S3R4_9PEZI|nr:hypothetical protein QBC46DRAFT_342628 [Diplogelasinospora grovesii]